MKIGITGISNGFGKYIVDNWSSKYEVIGVSLRKGIPAVVNEIKNCDVFINHAYNGTDQSEVFKYLFKLWNGANKTIVNFGSSAVHEVNGLYPEYIANKKHLYNLSTELSHGIGNKNVRVINFNPSTLESNPYFENFNKLKFSELSDILEYLINLPQHLEISEITIKNTRREKRTLT